MASLQTRILVFFLALLLAVLGVTVATVRRATYRQTVLRIHNELLHGRDVFADKLASRQRALWQVAETLTKDDALRQAIFSDPGDVESLVVALDNHRARTGADFAQLVGLDGRDRRQVAELEHAARPRLGGGDEERPSHRAGLAPEPQGRRDGGEPAQGRARRGGWGRMGRERRARQHHGGGRPETRVGLGRGRRAA